MTNQLINGIACLLILMYSQFGFAQTIDEDQIYVLELTAESIWADYLNSDTILGTALNADYVAGSSISPIILFADVSDSKVILQQGNYSTHTLISHSGEESSFKIGGAPAGLSFTVDTVTTSSTAIVDQEIVRILPNGNIGIAQSIPQYPLDVKGIARTNSLLIGTSDLVVGTVVTIDGAVHISPEGSDPIPFDDANYGIDYLLWVEKGIVTDDVVIMEADEWADYVFSPDYNLISLDSLSSFIATNKHLPNIPSQEDVFQTGYSEHRMNTKLLEKIEELTLYTIENNAETQRLKLLEQRLERIENLLGEKN